MSNTAKETTAAVPAPNFIRHMVEADLAAVAEALWNGTARDVVDLAVLQDQRRRRGGVA